MDGTRLQELSEVIDDHLNEFRQDEEGRGNGALYAGGAAAAGAGYAIARKNPNTRGAVLRTEERVKGAAASGAREARYQGRRAASEVKHQGRRAADKVGEAYKGSRIEGGVKEAKWQAGRVANGAEVKATRIKRRAQVAVGKPMRSIKQNAGVLKSEAIIKGQRLQRGASKVMRQTSVKKNAIKQALLAAARKKRFSSTEEQDAYFSAMEKTYSRALAALDSATK